MHDADSARVARVVMGWGVCVSEGSRHFSPPGSQHKIDLLVRAAGFAGRFLACDVTRRDSDDAPGPSALDGADVEKEVKYASLYCHPVTIRALAVDPRGRLSASAEEAVRLLVAAGARASGGHPADLRRELLQALALELMHGLAYLYARAAAINEDASVGVPQLSALCLSSSLFAAVPPSLRSRCVAATGRSRGHPQL